MNLHPTAVSAFASFLLASPALAQWPIDEREPDWWLGVDARAYERADLDSTGDLGLSRWGATLGREWPGNELGESFALAFRHEQSRYDFGGGATLFIPDPLDEGKRDSVTATYDSGDGEDDDDERWVGNLSVVSGRAEGLSLSDSVYGEAALGVLFDVSERFDLGLALAGRTRLEEDAQIFPLPLIDWRATDDLRVTVIPSVDPGLRATYTFSERFDAYVSVRLEERQYRLDNQGVLLQRDSVLRDEELGGLLGLVWHADHLDFEIFGGVAQRMLALDVDDEEFADDDLDAVGTIGASINWVF